MPGYEVMMEKQIALNGVGNARELGGYRIGNRQVRGGVLLRTAGLDHMTPEAADTLQNRYHVQTVIDLRMSVEHAAKPDPSIPGIQNQHLPVIELEDMLASIPGGADPKLLEAFTGSGRDRMQLFDLAYEAGFLSDRLYTDFLIKPRGRQAYRAFFEALMNLEEGCAILWHCTDGKDRTGCAAMLTLFALGADRETVLRDYLLTNTYNAQMLEAVRQRIAPLGLPPEKLNALLFMSGAVDEAHMNAAIDAMTREYGSVMGYLRDALGVGLEEIELLRRKYLTA